MKFLNIDEKKKLLSEGKSIPLRVKQDPNAEKKRKKLIAELQKNFSDTINNGKLDNYLVQPKSVLISCITSSVDVSAIGDMIYGLIMIVIYGLSIKNILLFLICGLCGALIIVSISIIFSSLSFWFGKTEMIADTINNLMINFSIYPEGIFQGVIKLMFYTIIPLGITTYIPVQIISDFNFNYLTIVLVATIFFVTLAFLVFYRGLRRYSSANLMNVRI